MLPEYPPTDEAAERSGVHNNATRKRASYGEANQNKELRRWNRNLKHASYASMQAF